MKNVFNIFFHATLKQRTLLLCIALFCTGSMQFLFGQGLANYSITSGTIVYNSIEYSGDAIFSWRNAGISTEDDNRSFQVPIGFDFYYIGQRYTMFSVSTNGFIDFSNSTRDGGPGTGTRSNWAFGPYDQDLSSSTRSAPSGDAGTVLAIAPFYYDLTTQGELDPLGGSIKYQVTGTAPNRVLTVEWIRMAIWTNTTPNFNFQLKLYESSGKIEFLYSTMTQGTFDWAASPTNGYTIGMSGPTISNPPTTGQVLIQQTANSTSFSAVQQNNLTTVPTANSIFTFTPVVPTAAPTNLSFSAVTTTGMTLTWNDNASNEVGYVIYRSDDGGVSYNFVRQLAANTTSSAETNLVPGTTYYWRVYALTVGSLSSALSGSMTTVAASQFISARTGNWGTGSTWVGGSVPTAYSKVIINNAHTVTINTDIQVSDLTVGQGSSGTLIIGNNTTARAVTIAGNLDIQSGATFTANASNNATHTMTIAGNITNAGTLELFPAASRVCNVTFTKAGSLSISGNGPTTHFNLMTLNMGSSKSNILDVFPSNFNAPNNFLTLTNGTFKLSTAATLTPFTATYTIPISAGLFINNSSAIVNTTGGTLNVMGDLIVTAGTLNAGNAVNNHLISYGGKIVFNGGTVNIAGGFIPKDNYTVTDLTMSSGTVTINTMGSNNTTYAPFSMLVSGSKLNQSGGTLVLQQKGTATGVDSLGYTNYFYSVYTVSGGTLQLGNASSPASQIMNIKSNIPINNLNIYDSKITAVLKDYPLTVRGNVDNSGGILNANGQNMTVGGTWTNTGSFTPSTAMVTFNGSAAQSVTRASGETFNKLTIAKSSGTLTLGSNVSVADIFSLSSGTLDIGANALTLNGPVNGGGTLISGNSGLVSYNKSSNGQNILKANYGNLSLSAFTKTLPSTDSIGIAGTFVSGLASGHTVTGSTVSFYGSGTQTIPVFNFNNLTLSASGTKTFSAGIDTVFGDLKIATGVIMDNGGATVCVEKNIINNGTHSGSGNITLAGGSSSHVISGTGTFTNLIMNDALGATFAGGDLIIKGALTLTSGVINPTVATNKVVIDVTGTLSSSSSSWINGILQRYIPIGSSPLVFAVGDGTKYTPATLAFGTISTAGTVTVSTTQGDHPQVAGSSIDPTNSVNRYWTLTNGSVGFDTCNIVFQWVNPGDQDVAGNEGLYIVGRYAGGTWDTTMADTKTVNSIRAVGTHLFGDFVVGFNGNANAYRTKGSGTGTGNWNSPTIWQYYNPLIATWRDTTVYPIATNAGVITIQSGDIVTIPVDIVVDQASVQTGAKIVVSSGQTLTVRDGSSTDLTVSGILTNNGNDIVVNSGASISFVNGSTYQHAIAGGNIPVASWSSTSTCEITGSITTAPGNLNQSFGNFYWNCALQTNPISLGGAPSIISGRFVVSSTGSSSIQLFNAGGMKTIGGSMIVAGGIVNGISGSASDWSRITLGDSLVISGGLFSLSSGTGGVMGIDAAGIVKVSGGTLRLSSTAAIDTIWAAKDFSHTAGIIDQTSSGRGRIIFDGTLPVSQQYTSGGTITGNIDFTVLNGASLILGTSTITGSGNFTLQDGATISLGSPVGITSSGATGNIQLTGSRTFGTGANYIYNGVVAQQTGNGLPTTVNKLTNLDSLGTLTLTGSVTVTDSLKLLKGTFSIGSNTLTLNNVAYTGSGNLNSGISGLVIYNRASDGQLVIPATYGDVSFSNFKKVLPAAQMTIAGSFTPGSATGHTITGDTINYNGGAQTIAAFQYNNLTTSGSGIKTLGGNTTVNGNLSLLAGSFADGAYTITVNGNIINNVTHTGIGKVFVTGGSSSHSLSGNGSYTNMDLNDVNGITASGYLRINGVLTLTSGIVSLGADTLVIGTSGTIERAANSLPRHIFGTVRKPVPVNAAPQTILFETGDLTKYTPVSVNFNAVSTAGTLTAASTAGDHSNINGSGISPTKSVNRTWTLLKQDIVFTTYNVTFNFDATDIDAGANSAFFFVKRYASSAWSTPTVTSRSSTSIRVDGLNMFGDFAVGEQTTIFYWSGLAGNHLWTDVNNWNLLNIPTISNDVILNGSDTIDVNTAAVCKNITIGNTSLVIKILPSNTLSASGNFTMTDGKLNTQNTFPTVTGVLTLSGGTVGYTSAGIQTIPVLAYYGLSVSGGSTKTAANALTVNQNLNIGSGTTFADGGFTITVKGSVCDSGVHSGSGKILLTSGSSTHQLIGAGIYKNLELNDAYGAAVVNGPVINGTLTLTNGILTSVSDTVYIVSPGTISRTNGYILGNLQKYVSTTGTVNLTYELGNSTLYLPVNVSLSGVSATGGSITVGSITGDHPDILNSSLKRDSSAHRYWTMSNNGVPLTSFTPTFRWSSNEISASITYAGDIIIANKTNTVPLMWTEVNVGSPSLTSIQGVSLTAFGIFQAGKPDSMTFTSVANGNWNAPTTWNKNRIPQPRDRALIVAPYTVTLTDARSINHLAIDNGGTFNNNGQVLTLNRSMLLSGIWSGSGSVVWNTISSDIFYGTNGVTNGTAVLQITGNNKTFNTSNTSLYQIDIASAVTVTNNGSMTVTRVTGGAASSTLINNTGASITILQDLLSMGTLTVSALNNTVTYGGTGSQTLKGSNYFNVGISGTRTGSNSVTFPSGGTVGIAGTFTPAATFGTGGYIMTNSTIDYNGTGAQTVAGFNYQNLTISGARSANITLASSPSIGIAGVFNPSATFSSGNYVSTGSTIDFNGSSDQTVPTFVYHNINFSNGGIKTPSSAIRVWNDLTINSGATFNAAATTDTVYGNWTASGNFTSSASRIVFGGSSASAINGSVSFAALEVKKNNPSAAVTLSSDVTVADLAVNQGLIQTGSNAITITSSRSGNGLIIGTITHTPTAGFISGSQYAFESPNNFINFNAGGTLPASITETVVLSSPGVNTYMEPINRYYTLSFAGGSGYTYAYRLHYEGAEVVNPNFKSTLKLWHESSPGVWDRMGVSSLDSINYWVQWDNVTTDGKYSLSSKTLANVTLSLSASAANPGPRDTVIYTITYNNTGDGIAANVLISAPVPALTTYAAGSIKVNGTPKPDLSAGITVGSVINLNLGTLLGVPITPGLNGSIEYKVVIN